MENPMRKRFAALIVLLLMLVLPNSASALETNELIAIAAMPLAVAAVADITDVPRDDLVTMVTTLNYAAVPAPQFIEIVRYSPVAFVDTREPRFVTYVTTEYDRGLVGDALALSIADRYETYGIREVRVVDPPAFTVVERQIVPQVVVTRLQPVEFDPLALIAMPLAVAAVADIADVPRGDLINFVTSLNRAMVPAPQFVEVVRYSPVVFVDSVLEPQFVTFVTTEVDRGVFGRDLAFAIGDRFRTIGIDDFDLVDPPTRVIVDRDVVIPPVVVTRVAERSHPHGGPPGQLKKDLGVQTGAEVVHGTHPSRRGRSRERAVSRGRDRDDDRDRVVVRERPKRVKPSVRREERRERPPEVRSDDRGRGRDETSKPRVVKPQRDRGSGGSGKPDHGDHGQAKGKGKGKGKG